MTAARTFRLSATLSAAARGAAAVTHQLIGPDISTLRAQRHSENGESLLGRKRGWGPQPAGRVAEAQPLAQPTHQPQLAQHELVRRLRGHRCHGLDHLFERGGSDGKLVRLSLRLGCCSGGGLCACCEGRGRRGGARRRSAVDVAHGTHGSVNSGCCRRLNRESRRRLLWAAAVRRLAFAAAAVASAGGLARSSFSCR